MDALLKKLSEQQDLLEKHKQKQGVVSSENEDKTATGRTLHERGSSSPTTDLMTPASESFNDEYSHKADKEDDTVELDVAEMMRLKKELDAAKDQIARQKQELDQTRIMKHTLHQAIGSSADAEAKSNGSTTEETRGPHPATLSPSSRSGNPRHEVHWDARSAMSDAPSMDNFNAAQNIWQPSNRPVGNVNFSTGMTQQYQPSGPIWGQPGGRPWGNKAMANNAPQLMMPQQQQLLQQRTFSGPASPVSSTDFNQFQAGPPLRRSNTQTRAASLYPQVRDNGWDAYGGGIGSLDGMTMGMNPNGAGPYQALTMYGAPMPYQPRPIGTPLSPTAAEFRAGQAATNPWNAAVSHRYINVEHCANSLTQPPASPEQTYVSPMEPLNYRRLLDRSVTCNWKYIVDKIVCNNDQQASIFLQQKLKVGTVEQKFEIVEAIVAQAYPLMVNRFGNFLVQRCFEHGTPEQVIAIANAIRGNTLSLSMDAFGCHVVQKAFDVVPEDYKAIMVHELLRRIPETVIHRYACHVWQKLFELRWSDSPPQIMKYVNEALKGMWHDVALGETGSLVVQNIFENCLEEDKVRSDLHCSLGPLKLTLSISVPASTRCLLA